MQAVSFHAMNPRELDGEAVIPAATGPVGTNLPNLQYKMPGTVIDLSGTDLAMRMVSRPSTEVS